MNLRFLVDASTDAGVAIHLKALGYDATQVGWDYPSRLPDRERLAIAINEDRIVVTDDRDFGELVFRESLPHAGVIYLRLERTALEPQLTRLDLVLREHARDLRAFIVVTEVTVRVREVRAQPDEPDRQPVIETAP